MALPADVQLILAPNPSKMTGAGTNTYVIAAPGAAALAIDPGPDIPAHLAHVATVADAKGGLGAILITHGHPDHVGGAAALRALTGAPIYGWSREGSPALDISLADDEVITLGTRRLRALYTPGHRFDHLSFALEDAAAIFTGDLVAGEGTVVIAPPEGELGAYLASLRRLLAMDARQLLPAHGPTIDDPHALLTYYIAHREERERQVLAGLATGPQTVPHLVARIYADVDPQLHPIAARSVLAHLLLLERDGQVTRTPAVPGGEDVWRRAGGAEPTPSRA